MGFWNARSGRVLGVLAVGMLAGSGLAWGQGGSMPADLTGDGVVNDRDVVEWMRGFYGRQSLNAPAFARLDFNRDGVLSGSDLSAFRSAMGAAAYGALPMSALWREAQSAGWFDARADFNGDGRNDQEDVVLWLTALMAPQFTTPAIVQAADVNGDSSLTGHDLSVLLSAMGSAGRALDMGALRGQVQALLTGQPPAGGGGSGGGSTPSGGGALASASGGSSAPGGSGGGSGGGATPIAPPPPMSGPFIPSGGPGAGAPQAPIAVVVGNGRGADARAIARFDTPPHQTIAGEFNVGVVAFHMNGIDRVEFSANGGAAVAVSEMRENPHSGVWEYWATLRASDFADGLVEVRAVAFPRVGIPRDLGILPFWANSRGQLPSPERYVSSTGDDVSNDGTRERPYRSIFRAAMALASANGGHAGGGRVYLLEGEHDWGRAGYNANGAYIGNLAVRDRWLEITAAPGATRENVRITSASPGGLKASLVKVSNVTLQGVGLGNSISSGASPQVWLDRCEMVGPDRVTDIKWASVSGFPGGIFVTDSSIRGGRYGVIGAALVRGVTVESTGDDAFTNCAAVINSTARDIRTQAQAGFHADVVQLHASDTAWNNVIVYNVRGIDCISQGWHIGYTGHRKGPDWSDIAFVNYAVDVRDPNFTAQWIPSANHVLWWNMTMLGGPVVIRNNAVGGAGVGEVTNIRNFDVRNCVFQKLIVTSTGQTPRSGDQSWAGNNHFIDSTSYAAAVVGINATSGGSVSSLLSGVSTGDLRSTGTVLRGRTPSPVVIVDANGRRVDAERAIGALQP